MPIDISIHIADLLYERDTVILPGIGGFVSQYKPAEIDQVQGKLTPPTKELLFNKNLSVDDGTLTGYIQRKYGLSYEEAREAVEQYARTIKEAIENREIIVFPKVGRLYLDFEQNLQFLPDKTNFNTDSFGLPTVQFYPVLRKEKPPVAKGTTIGQSTASRGWSAVIASWFHRYIWVILSLTLIVVSLGVYLAFFDKKKGSASPRETAKDIPASRFNVKPSMEPAAEAPGGDVSPEDAEEMTEITDTEEVVPLPGQKYVIIGIGKFRNQGNVDKLVKKIFDAGFDPFVEKNGNLTQVGVQVPYDKESEIEAALEAVRNRFEPDAMVLKKGVTGVNRSPHQ